MWRTDPVLIPTFGDVIFLFGAHKKRRYVKCSMVSLNNVKFIVHQYFFIENIEFVNGRFPFPESSIHELSAFYEKVLVYSQGKFREKSMRLLTLEWNKKNCCGSLIIQLLNEAKVVFVEPKHFLNSSFKLGIFYSELNHSSAISTILHTISEYFVY